MNSLLFSVKNRTQTQNGALSKVSTGSKLLDFFAQGAAYRARSYKDVIALFKPAFDENPIYALKALFYFRDIRGGQGERHIFRAVIQYLASNGYAEILVPLIKYVPEFGRWDDLLALEGTPLQKTAFTLFANQLLEDYKNLDNAKANITLAGKWAPSENASSAVTKILAANLRNYTGLNSKQYRKMLSALRGRINVVERQMCSNNWSDIDFSTVPSNAGFLYRKAFAKHEPTRYAQFHQKVQKGEAKVNAAALYPYEVIRPLLQSGMHKVGDSYYANVNTALDPTVLDNTWRALPNYLTNDKENALVVVDTSGSMTHNLGLPIQVAISLGIYIAERNHGPFQDYFISFSSEPVLQKVKGSTIVDKVNNLAKTKWGSSTNLQAVFNLILGRAVQDGVSAEDMPKTIYIVSDMEFNQAVSQNNLTNYEAIREKYADAGYSMPKIVFWNVNSRSNQVAAKQDDKNVVLVSGCSPSILKNLLAGKETASKETNPYQAMMDVLNDERYSVIAV